MNGEDPGWGPTWRMLLMLLPGGARLAMRGSNDGLQLMRTLFLSFCSAIVLFGLVLLLMGSNEIEDAPSPGPWALGLAAYGVFYVICVVMAAIKASQGQDFRYPLTIRLIS